MLALVAAILGSSALGFDACEHLEKGTPPENSAAAPSPEEYDKALETLDMEAVKADMTALLADSKECWPADFGNYGPFMVRLAWHCAGSYRGSDGVGGCGGGRQRFEPERSWPDNTNLDKARALVAPLKEKYGDALSWGDLFILAGTTALRDAGAPVKQMCFGRMDDSDGAKSVMLGPTALQAEKLPCVVNGECKPPLGATTVGLVYVNPEGPMANPDPALSANDIRQTFSGMGHCPHMTTALIGGGHALGKGHGACPKGAGLAPNEAYNMTPRAVPWVGQCGTGKGADTVTAGFEGAWTTNPLKWDNEYFKWLVEKDWEKHVGPGGHWQWRIKDSDEKVMRLTADMALLHDPMYRQIVELFAKDMDAFNRVFDAAWYGLTVASGSGTWSKAAKCDNGPFPEELRKTSAYMVNSDVTLAETEKPLEQSFKGVTLLSAMAVAGASAATVSVVMMRFRKQATDETGTPFLYMA